MTQRFSQRCAILKKFCTTWKEGCCKRVKSSTSLPTAVASQRVFLRSKTYKDTRPSNANPRVSRKVTRVASLSKSARQSFRTASPRGRISPTSLVGPLPFVRWPGVDMPSEDVARFTNPLKRRIFVSDPWGGIEELRKPPSVQYWPLGSLGHGRQQVRSVRQALQLPSSFEEVRLADLDALFAAWTTAKLGPSMRAWRLRQLRSITMLSQAVDAAGPCARHAC